jgi:3-methylfumaryl-CoA hydratase
VSDADAAPLTLAELGLPAEQAATLSADHAALVAATLDAPPPGRELPLLWHWAYFHPAVPTAALGDDGHPRREGALLATFPRRMWVGGSVERRRALRTDVPARRRTELAQHRRTHGSSGELLIVSLQHTVEQEGAEAVVERQDVVYRGAGGATPPPGDPVDPPADAEVQETVVPGSPLLFRFSAVTFNSHRIHYDRRYATEVEGYPGLVVHGPLTAMLLADLGERLLGSPVRRFDYRASNPLFADQPVYLLGNRTTGDGGGPAATLRAVRVDGAVAMTATALA